MRRRRLQVGVVALIILFAGYSPARANSVRFKRMRFVESSGYLTVSTSYTELFDEKAFANLSSGVPTTVVARFYVYRKKPDSLVSMTTLTSRVVYDLWDESYLVEQDGPKGRKTRRFQRRADVLRAVSSIDSLPLAFLSQVVIGPHYIVAVTVELNPVQEELLSETRRWLSKRSDESLDTGASFFGSFVSVFVNPKLQDADRVLRLRSQPFYRVKR